MLGLGSFDREGEEERRALARLAFHPDLAPVSKDQRSADGKAEAGAFLLPAGPVGLRETGEELRAEIFGDPGPPIAHLEADDVALLLDEEIDGPRLRRELEGVREEIREHLDDAIAIGANRRQPVRKGALDRDPYLPGEPVDALDGLGAECRHVGRSRIEL